MTSVTVRSIWTGSRHWEDRPLIIRYLEGICSPEDRPHMTLVHGDCPTGLDAIVAEEAPKLGYNVEAHPANWDKHGKAAGPIRNQEMVDLGATTCIAFPAEHSRGTIDCMRRAVKAGIITVAALGTEQWLPPDLAMANVLNIARLAAS